MYLAAEVTLILLHWTSETFHESHLMEGTWNLQQHKTTGEIIGKKKNWIWKKSLSTHISKYCDEKFMDNSIKNFLLSILYNPEGMHNSLGI